MKIDPQVVEKIIAEVAADEIMPRFRRLKQGDIEMKGVDDPVTVADKAAENALIARLTAYLPGSVVVGEESYAEDSNIFSLFDRDGDVWVIDPIDGTRNFVAGHAEFGTMVGLVRNRRTIGAWIHDPVTGDTLAAEQGGGLWLRGVKMRLAANDGAAAHTALVGARLKKALGKIDPEALAALPPLETGSAAAFDYGRLFTGDRLFADSTQSRIAYLLYRQSKPWDHVPGLFMLAESGGHAASFDGQPYDMHHSKEGLLIAPTLEKWQQFDRILKRLLPGIAL